MKGFLSPIEITPLTVRIIRNGTITVSVTGQTVPFLSYNDSDVLNVQFISFTTWGTNEIKWFYDCEKDAGNKLTRMKQKLRGLDQLKNDLFDMYEYKIAPNDVNYILLDFHVDAITYEAKKSTMISRGKFRAVNNRQE